MPQAALGVLLDIFYGLLARRQVLHLAAGEEARAVALVELSNDLKNLLMRSCSETIHAPSIPGALNVPGTILWHLCQLLQSVMKPSN